MDEQKRVHITLFQAPFASLMDCGLYMKMHDPSQPFRETVPAEYYLTAFDGEIECPEQLPKDQEQRAHAVLEQAFSIFNNAHPAGYCGRSLSVSDIVQLEGKHYLCGVCGFAPVTFSSGQDKSIGSVPQSCTLTMPDGTVLRASVHPEPEYPCINIDIIADGGIKDRVCFVEHNPEKEPGHELCIGVYCSDDDETVYYNSYNQGEI